MKEEFSARTRPGGAPGERKLNSHMLYGCIDVRLARPSTPHTLLAADKGVRYLIVKPLERTFENLMIFGTLKLITSTVTQVRSISFPVMNLADALFRCTPRMDSPCLVSLAQ